MKKINNKFKNKIKNQKMIIRNKIKLNKIKTQNKEKLQKKLNLILKIK